MKGAENMGMDPGPPGIPGSRVLTWRPRNRHAECLHDGWVKVVAAAATALQPVSTRNN